MAAPSNQALIERAAAVLKPYKTADGRLFGDVGAALVSESGRIFEGVCVDTASWGLCAERSAIAAMVTAGEYRIDRVVAVWRDAASNKLHVLPPCGHCRQFMRELDDANLATTVILGLDRARTLAELLPEHEWPAAIDQR
jgi:cytidine deaminase